MCRLKRGLVVPMSLSFFLFLHSFITFNEIFCFKNKNKKKGPQACTVGRSQVTNKKKWHRDLTQINF